MFYAADSLTAAAAQFMFQIQKTPLLLLPLPQKGKNQIMPVRTCVRAGQSHSQEFCFAVCMCVEGIKGNVQGGSSSTIMAQISIYIFFLLVPNRSPGVAFETDDDDSNTSASRCVPCGNVCLSLHWRQKLTPFSFF